MLTHKFLGFCVKLLTIYHFLILSHSPAIGLTDILYGYILTLYLQVSLLFVCWVSFHAFFVFLPTFFQNELFQKFFQDRHSPAIGPNCLQSLVPGNSVCVVAFCLSQQFSAMSGRFTVFLGCTVHTEPGLKPWDHFMSCWSLVQLITDCNKRQFCVKFALSKGGKKQDFS